jgi:hypothetical protein
VKSAVQRAAEALRADEMTIFWAFRYALGRMTYAVPHVIGIIRDNAHLLSANTKALIVKEITEAEGRGGLGMEYDVGAWTGLRAALSSGGGEVMPDFPADGPPHNNEQMAYEMNRPLKPAPAVPDGAG